MKIYLFTTRQTLPISLDTAWSFFSNPSKLIDLTPPWLNFRVTSELPERMYPGMIVTYQVCPFGNIPISWVTEITQVQEPYLFIDEQRFGPYRFWHHQHRFKETAGGVEMIDLVHYALPFGVLGRGVHRLSVAPRLREIFDFRREWLEKFWGKSAADDARAARA